MERIFLIISISILIISCQSNKKDTTETKSIEVEVENDSEKLNQLFDQFESIYTELLGFKDESDFLKYGFRIGDGKNSAFDHLMPM
jgi:hypothetical protein